MPSFRVSLYKLHLLTFIDILGFKALVAESSDPQPIEHALEDLQRNTPEPGPGLKKHFPASVWNFSDTVVRAIPITQRAAFQSHLASELYVVALAQRTLTAKGINIRGGIAIGELRASPQRLFGPALVRAHELESTKAIYPRILVSDDLLSYARISEIKDPSLSEAEHVRRYTNNLVQQDFDGMYFVHYMDYLHLHAGALGDEQIVGHRNQILASWARHSKNLKVRAKVGWQAHYHDRTVAGFPEEFFAKSTKTPEDYLCRLLAAGPIAAEHA